LSVDFALICNLALAFDVDVDLDFDVTEVDVFRMLKIKKLIIY